MVIFIITTKFIAKTFQQRKTRRSTEQYVAVVLQSGQNTITTISPAQPIIEPYMDKPGEQAVPL